MKPILNLRRRPVRRLLWATMDDTPLQPGNKSKPVGVGNVGQETDSGILPISSAHTATAKESSTTELEAFNKIVSAVQSVPEDARSRLFKSVLTFLGYSEPSPRVTAVTVAPERTSQISSFSEDRAMSAKEFMLQKKPVTDIEKIACLAYYLTHYRDTPHFKTLDLSKLNTEAAQIKFSNAATAVDNATSSHLLVASGKGAKQISAIGELYVEQLPDRDAAKAAIAHAKPRKKHKKQPDGKESSDKT